MAFKYIESKNENGLSGINLDKASRENNQSFINTKIEFFREYKNYSNKIELINLFKEIIDRIKDDEQNAVFEIDGIKDQLGDIEQSKHQAILAYQIGYSLGFIILNVFDFGDNRIRAMTDGSEGAILTKEILEHGIREFLSKKEEAVETQSTTHAYGANFIFVSIFEEEMKLHIERYYSKKYLGKLKQKVDDGTVTLTDEEDKLFDYLCNRVEIKTTRKHNIQFNSIYASGKQQYDLLNKYTDISTLSAISELYSGNTTLNKMRSQSYFKDIVDETFADLLTYLFGVKHLNLRNNLAHGNLAYFDYHSLGYTAILYLLITMVSNEFFYKDGIN